MCLDKVQKLQVDKVLAYKVFILNTDDNTLMPVFISANKEKYTYDCKVKATTHPWGNLLPYPPSFHAYLSLPQAIHMAVEMQLTNRWNTRYTTTDQKYIVRPVELTGVIHGGLFGKDSLQSYAATDMKILSRQWSLYEEGQIDDALKIYRQLKEIEDMVTVPQNPVIEKEENEIAKW